MHLYPLWIYDGFMATKQVPATNARLLDAIRISVTCWDRATTHRDFAEQMGAHIEDMRDIVRASDLRLATRRRKVIRYSDGSVDLAHLTAGANWGAALSNPTASPDQQGAKQ